MSYNCCSRNFSSCSLGRHLSYSGSSCGSCFPSNLVYRTDLCPGSSCQLGSSLYSQETCCEPIRTQTFRVVSRPCQTSCYHPRTSTFFSPCPVRHLCLVLRFSSLWGYTCSWNISPASLLALLCFGKECGIGRRVGTLPWDRVPKVPLLASFLSLMCIYHFSIYC